MSAPERPEARGLAPESCVRGEFRPSGSKSLAQRALLSAAVAHGTTAIEGLSEAEDVQAALRVLAALGVGCERLTPSCVRVRGVPPASAAGLEARAALEVGESGTLARLLTALLALASRPGERWTIVPAGSLLFRKSASLFAALESCGVRLARQNLQGTWPVELVSSAPPQALSLTAPVSSQEVSGLLLALAASPGERTLHVRGRIPSTPYLAMSARLLEAFGASVASQPAGSEALRLVVRGPLSAPARGLVIEPDASSAAVALAAACLSGGELFVPDLARDSAQGDVRIVEHLQAFGCQARFEGAGLAARGFPQHGAELELAGEPDLAPVLSAVAAGAALRSGATSVLRGLATLPGKESDRLACLLEGLQAVGLAATAGSDWLRVAPGARGASEPVTLDPRGDHRMVFAFALLGLLRAGVRVRAPDCVAKSWGGFWRDMEDLGARLAPP